MQEAISVFDMLKIGVGPSSSHTLGPWRAAQRFLSELNENGIMRETVRIRTDLYGSLSLTGTGHATDLAVMLGLSGQDPEFIPVAGISGIIDSWTMNDQCAPTPKSGVNCCESGRRCLNAFLSVVILRESCRAD